MKNHEGDNPGDGTDIAFRDCTAADIPAVLRLWADGATVPGSTDSEEALLTRLGRDPDLFVLAFDGEVLAGCLMGGWDGWRGNLYRLVVLPAYRRRGIGERLVRMVEERLQRLGAVRVYALAVRTELEPAATKFWEAVGYEVNPRLQPYVRTLGGREPTGG